MDTATALQNWLPVRISKTAPPLQCQWLYIGDKEFTEPFFDETISACRYQWENNRRYKILSTPEMMNEWAAPLDPLPPSAVIFHVSRCGSTLLSQLLAGDRRNSVLSEVPFLDDVLRLPFQQAAAKQQANGFFRAALRFYAQKRQDRQQHLFVKTDSWHVHFYEIYREVFPDVPFVFLFRHPLPVLLSQQKQRSLQAVPGMIEPAVFGLTGSSCNGDLDAYFSQVIVTYFGKMIQVVKNDPLVFAFDYAEGMETIIQTLYATLRISLPETLKEQFSERCRFHAKRPGEFFSETESKQSIPGFLAPAVALYEELALLSKAGR